jgi:transcription-repair coupling factor (superfamily II helicase)
VDRTLDLNLADLASVTDEVAAQPGVAQLASALESALPARVRVPEAALAPVLAALWQRRRGEERAGIAVLVDDDETAREVADEAAWYAPAEMVGFVPSRGVAYGSGLEPAPHLVGERARGLGLLEAGGLVAISAAALVERVPPRERRAAALHAERGGELVRDEAVAALVAAGYSRVERVGDRGELAVRGDILDVFPTTGAEPVRIELFGDEVERISRFSVFTQRSLAELERCDLQPAREARRAPADVEEWTHEEDVPVPNDLVSLAPELIAHGVVCAWQPDRVLDAARDRLAEAAASHSRSARERAYVGEAAVVDLLEGVSALDTLQGDTAFDAQRPALAGRGISEAEAELLGLVRSGLRVVVAFPHRGDAERTQLALRRVDAGLLAQGQPLPDEAGVVFAVSPLRRGVVWPTARLAVVSAQQLFRRRAAGAAVAGRLGRALSSAADLRPDDYVVHVEHGVGRFLGFDTKTVGGVTRDYVNLQFKGEDRLFVPHDQLAKLSRYIGADGRPPALSKLGGKAWHTLRSRARAAVHELAGELLRLYAVRQTRSRPPYDDEEGWLERMERAFAYTETEDQGRAIDEVLEDLTSEQPMDRLICGDVGFGKTEVAMRAAFLVAISGRQVLVLAPTTLLVQQHLQTFRDRFRDFPVRVEAVSRMRDAAEVKQALREFSEGKIEVLIGTHRVLSRDVIPKQLGLIVVDEEQRFGVRQKELLRQLRLEVDALSMSATPIPRTLHMSLAGLRDISVIATPPRGRQPIRTHVAEYDETLVAAAIRRELGREGQVFYLHNRVETIHEAAEKIRRLVPEARVGVGHGQMDDRALEQAMVEFLRGDLDVLVATTIIESGLDIPQVNTLVIERADMLGLAQLYQIRGRVGRGENAAHAYLMYPDGSELSEEARARLAALADYTELGSGYRVALRDLELRGAGSLLGDEQSGHVAAVGFELYCDLLAEAVAELSGNRGALMRPVRLDLALDAYVPADYVAYEAAKLDVHRRIALAESVDELRDIQIELTDRFGEPPEPVENLILAQEARIKLAALGADSLTVRGTRASLARITLGPADLRELRERHGRVLYNAAAGEIGLPLSPERPLAQVIALTDTLGDLVKPR